MGWRPLSLSSIEVCASLNISQLGIATKPAVALSVTGAFALTFVRAPDLGKVSVRTQLQGPAATFGFKGFIE